MNAEPGSAPSRAIVCSLGGAAMAGRFEQWRDLARRARVAGAPHPQGAVLRYRRQPGVEDELRRLVALEADCCAFLAFDLVAAGAELRLTVTGPAEAAPLIRECWGVS
jgi:hypothetical protein